MSYARNDGDVVVAIEVPRDELDGAALFPAIATKNQVMEVDFGQKVSDGDTVQEGWAGVRIRCTRGGLVCVGVSALYPALYPVSVL